MHTTTAPNPLRFSSEKLKHAISNLAGRKTFYFETDGFCPICEKAVVFSARKEWFRDNLLCSGCGSIPRERALMMVIEKLYPNWRSLAIHESSPINRGVSPKLKLECPNYSFSHYDPSIPFGSIHETHGYRSESLEAMTFDAASFDLIITQDVFEHIFHPGTAMKEIARTLKPGGAHLCTVPIVRKSEASRRRASVNGNNEITHHLEAQYHCNPVDGGGSLVTIDWGYDIAAYMTEVSGLVTTLFTIDDLSHGVRAEYIEIMANQKLVALANL